MRKYRLIAKKGEGSSGEVIKAQNIETGTFHAIKCMKSSYKNADEVNSLREIQALKRLTPHQNIVKLDEVLFDPPSGRLALIFELMEGNLYELMKDRVKSLQTDRVQHFGEATVKMYMRQIFTALSHMHGKGVFHRHIKPENILVDKHGKHLKLAGFGSCRGINGKPPFTEHIATRWYRSPECLLTCGMYGPEMDVWGAGCILFELTTLYPLFPGSDEADQVHRIHRVLGTPKASVVAKLRKHASAQANFAFALQHGIGISKLLPDAAPHCVDLLKQSLAYDTAERITSKRATKHPYFVGDHPSPSAAKSTHSTRKRPRRAKVAPQTLRGYTMVFVDHTRNEPYYRAKGADVIVLSESEAPSHCEKAFRAWWDDVTGKRMIVVLKDGWEAHKRRYPYCQWLENIEEEEFDKGVHRLRFSTAQELKKADIGGGLMIDDWGDAIERGG